MPRDDIQAFDLWLKRSLTEQFRPVLMEPVSKEILHLLDGHMPEP